MSAARQNKPQVSPRRRALLAKVHIAKKQLGLSDDVYRDCVAAVVPGIYSAKHLTDAHLEQLIRNFKLRGFKGGVTSKKKAGYRTQSKRPMIRKIYVLWGILYRNKKTRAKKPDAWIARMTKRPSQPDGVGNTEWLEDAQAYSIIESLKKWIIREGLAGELD